MHAVIAARLRRSGERPVRSSLRFIRSCSAPLMPSLLLELESVFGVPVVEAYGMTEGSHQIASNPLPPRARKPGSVGLPTGTEVAVLDGSDAAVPCGVSGEVAIRGEAVTRGYDGDAKTVSGAVCRDWLRTGDLGHFDEDGYLVLDGRVKDVINRAGEKISPAEVEPVLAAHPAVAQVAVFGAPDPTLGEMVAAAVVPHEGSTLDAAAVRAFAAGRLAPFKIPTRILVVDEIPKGPTGKVRRHELGRLLGLA
jgi:acyl-CoA synthetase (AMP-forming)/AMP-acid ligase II